MTEQAFARSLHRPLIYSRKLQRTVLTRTGVLRAVTASPHTNGHRQMRLPATHAGLSWFPYPQREKHMYATAQRKDIATSKRVRGYQTASPLYVHPKRHKRRADVYAPTGALYFRGLLCRYPPNTLGFPLPPESHARRTQNSLQQPGSLRVRSATESLLVRSNMRNLRVVIVACCLVNIRPLTAAPDDEEPQPLPPVIVYQTSDPHA